MAATYSNLLYHIVFSTKERRGLITTAIEPELYAYIGGIIRNNDGTLLEIGGVKDHIHLLFKLPPKLQVAAETHRLRRYPGREGQFVQVAE